MSIVILPRNFLSCCIGPVASICMDLSIVIPAYNERQRLPASLTLVLEYFSKQTVTWEIVVIDDGSTDGTSAQVQAINHPQLRLIRHEQNQGKGAAVRTGMLAASGSWRLLTDADLSTPIEDWVKLWSSRDGVDIVIGSRRAPGADVQQPQSPIKVLAGQIGNLLIRIFVVPGIRDTQCGFKLFSAGTRPVFEQQRLHGFGFDFEILFIARKFGLRMVEVPVHWANQVGSKVKFKHYLSTLIEILAVRWNDLRGIYQHP